VLLRRRDDVGEVGAEVVEVGAAADVAVAKPCGWPSPIHAWLRTRTRSAAKRTPASARWRKASLSVCPPP
jgi:hypothetical protein